MVCTECESTIKPCGMAAHKNSMRCQVLKKVREAHKEGWRPIDEGYAHLFRRIGVPVERKVYKYIPGSRYHSASELVLTCGPLWALAVCDWYENSEVEQQLFIEKLKEVQNDTNLQSLFIAEFQLRTPKSRIKWG